MKFLAPVFALCLATPATAQQQIYVAAGQSINAAVARALDTCSVITLGPGTWYETIDLVHAPVCPKTNDETSPMVIQGSGADKTFWNGCPTCSGTLVATGAGTDVAIRQMYIYSTGSPNQNTLYAQQGAKINVLDGVVFGESTNQQLHCENVGSSIQLWRDYTIASGTLTGNHMAATTQCNISAGPLTVTLGPNLIFGGPFAFAQLGSGINLSVTWQGGPVNGRKFIVESLSYITTNGAGCASLPGNVAGIKINGGLCL